MISLRSLLVAGLAVAGVAGSAPQADAQINVVPGFNGLSVTTGTSGYGAFIPYSGGGVTFGAPGLGGYNFGNQGNYFTPGGYGNYFAPGYGSITPAGFSSSYYPGTISGTYPGYSPYSYPTSRSGFAYPITGYGSSRVSGYNPYFPGTTSFVNPGMGGRMYRYR